MTHGYGQYEYSDFNGVVFAFIGQRATTGQPNPTTGKYSQYGCMYGPFASYKEAREYVGDRTTREAQIVCAIGTARTLRRYRLGTSVQAYLEELDHAITDPYKP